MGVAVNAAEMTLIPLFFMLLLTAEDSIILSCLNNKTQINVIHVTVCVTEK